MKAQQLTLKITPDGILDHTNFKLFQGGMPPDPLE